MMSNMNDEYVLPPDDVGLHYAQVERYKQIAVTQILNEDRRFALSLVSRAQFEEVVNSVVGNDSVGIGMISCEADMLPMVIANLMVAAHKNGYVEYAKTAVAWWLSQIEEEDLEEVYHTAKGLMDD